MKRLNREHKLFRIHRDGEPVSISRKGVNAYTSFNAARNALKSHLRLKSEMPVGYSVVTYVAIAEADGGNR